MIIKMVLSQDLLTLFKDIKNRVLYVSAVNYLLIVGYSCVSLLYGYKLSYDDKYKSSFIVSIMSLFAFILTYIQMRSLTVQVKQSTEVMNVMLTNHHITNIIDINKDNDNDVIDDSTDLSSDQSDNNEEQTKEEQEDQSKEEQEDQSKEEQEDQSKEDNNEQEELSDDETIVEQEEDTIDELRKQITNCQIHKIIYRFILMLSKLKDDGFIPSFSDIKAAKTLYHKLKKLKYLNEQ